MYIYIYIYIIKFSPHRIPSFFSMDIDGRVLRFDSFSKVISAGMRLGWVSGPRPLIHRIILHSQVNIYIYKFFLLFYFTIYYFLL